MPLTTIKKQVRQTPVKPNIEIDIAAFLEDGETDTKIKFREPRSTDLFIPKRRRDRIKASNPLFSDELVGQVALLASCYVPGKGEESGVDLDDIVAGIANDHRDLFLHMVNKFGEAYPMKVSKEEAGNG